MGIENERKKLSKSLDRIEALLYMTFQLIPENVTELKSVRSKLMHLSKAELISRQAYVDTQIKKLSKKIGLKVPLRKVLEWHAAIVKGISSGGVIFVGFWEFGTYFSNLDEIFGSEWEGFSRHAMLGFIPKQTEKYRYEWYLPEAQVYMDMCVCINELILLAAPNSDLSYYQVRKKQSAFRGAILNSYIFLEAYLNGIALDFAFRHPDKMTKEIETLVFEWDFLKSKRKYLSTRDKIFRYVKIITGQDCPLQENNCPEMKFVTEVIEPFRDSIVHPAIFSYQGHSYDHKMHRHFRTDLKTAFRAVDNVIALVRRMNLIVKGPEAQLKWLKSRDEKNGFPNEAFE